MTVAPSRTCAWLPMHRLQPGISVRAPACRTPRSGLPRISRSSILVGGPPTSLTGMSRWPPSSLAGGAEVADVGHARTDEGFVDLGAGHFGQELGVVRVVGAADDGPIDDRSGRSRSRRRIPGVLVGPSRVRLGQPGFDLLDAARGSCVLVAVGDHVLHEHDVAGQVLTIGSFVELDGAASGAERSADASTAQTPARPSGLGRPSI